MKELRNLADKSLATQILDHEAYGLKIQQIFQRVKEATMTFFVCTIMFILRLCIFWSFPAGNDDQHSANGEWDTRWYQGKYQTFLVYERDWLIEQKAALKSLRPSEKADHKTVLEEQGLKREVCTNGTRVKILEDITKWANDRSLASPRVF